MNDKAAFQNVSEAETKASGGLTASGTYDIANHAPAASVDASLDLSGTAQRGGTVNRAEKIQLSVAVVVVRASPNGNLVIAGTQEVRVNHELRLLTVEGVVRAIDILPDNTIPTTRSPRPAYPMAARTRGRVVAVSSAHLPSSSTTPYP